ncbi:MAG TPA: aldehyde ferredoxin oxidoreductase family protein [Candidatus Lokiarchaeia archaeon]
MYGFIGKILRVDLTGKKITEEPLDKKIAEQFLGAAGYCCRYLYDKLNKNTDPLSQDNILMFMTGPFCGSSIATSGRFVVCAKSPYTGLWGESNCGGFLGPEIKKAGYDGIIITGASKTPVYLEITNEKKEIKDAKLLWGKGTLETTEILKKQSGSNLTRVACIGQGGENLVRYATIASEEKAAGRTGMGAVMGSKKLKAITVRGKKGEYIPADKDGFKAAVSETNNAVSSSFMTQMMASLGTAGGVDMYNSTGELPIKYWTQGEWDGAFNISGATASEKIFSKSNHCFSCPIGCAKKAMVKEGEYATPSEIEAPEYETVAGFGSMILNNNLESIVRANYLCNDYGIDTISGSSTIAFIYYLFNSGKIKSNDIDGLDPKWGNEKPMLELIRKISFREGIGNILADGSDAAGKKFKVSSDEIATVYGMEVPYHDLRSCYGMAIAYGVGSPRGPCHNSCDMYNILLGIPLDEVGISYVDKYSDDEEMAKYSALAQNYRAFYSSLIICSFAFPLPSSIAKLIQTATGIECDVEKVKSFAERIYTIKRLFNLKMGITPSDDRLPQILLKPMKEGGSAGKTPNFQKLKDAYYKFRGWDPKTGKPSNEILKKLGLEKL